MTKAEIIQEIHKRSSTKITEDSPKDDLWNLLSELYEYFDAYDISDQEIEKKKETLLNLAAQIVRVLESEE